MSTVHTHTCHIENTTMYTDVSIKTTDSRMKARFVEYVVNMRQLRSCGHEPAGYKRNRSIRIVTPIHDTTILFESTCLISVWEFMRLVNGIRKDHPYASITNSYH